MDLIWHPLSSYNIEYAGPTQQILNRKPTCLLKKLDKPAKKKPIPPKLTINAQNILLKRLDPGKLVLSIEFSS